MPRQPIARHDYTLASNPYSHSDTSSSHSSSPTASPASASAPVPASKKKHVCATCERVFSTSGHLARHLKVHTGERNHKCPFPGCETRCSRQDNLQQHYRIHLSPGSRRSSSSATRAAIARVVAGKSTRGGSLIKDSVSVSPSPPPALEPATIRRIDSPPLSPPPLVQAYLSVPPMYAQSMPSTSRPSSPPERNPYPNVSQGSHIQSAQMTTSPVQSHYASSSSGYAQPASAEYAYVHAPPAQQIGTSAAASLQDQAYGYSSQQYGTRMSSAQHHSPPVERNNGGSPHSSSPQTHSMSSRLAISHISDPRAIPAQGAYPPMSTPSPDSSVGSHHNHHASAPHSPNYTYRDDGHSRNGSLSYGSTSIDIQGTYQSSNHYGHGGYVSSQSAAPRYDSPPPTLAPIQNERVMRGMQGVSLPDMGAISPMHYGSHGNMGNGYSYHPSSYNTSWKPEIGIRRSGTASYV